jgi:short-subunit dehydrogenase
LRVELKPWNIEVAMIQPAAMETAIFDKANKVSDRSLKQIPPDKLALYKQALESYQNTIANQPVNSPDLVKQSLKLLQQQSRKHGTQSAGAPGSS